MNLPNRITITRIIMIPIFLFFLLPFPEWFIDLEVLGFMKLQLVNINAFILQYGNFIAAGIFILAASTDGLDGYIARKRKQVTKFGKFIDPIADKLLVTAALIALVQRGDVTGWAATIIISREFLVTGLRLVAAAEGIVISASKLGKIKTVFQMIAIIATLIKNYPITYFVNFPFDRWAMFFAVIITIYSGYDYIMKNAEVIDIKS
jgi:CDP-diacylglycerol---glycerol-3-phosphate 3-phosphatidyltransferase